MITLRHLTSFVLLVGLLGACAASTNAQAQDVRSGVVKITVTAPALKTGAGIVVRRNVDEAYIVTAAHVVTGADKIEVQFFGVARSWLAEVMHLEAEDLAQGLALLRVSGSLPAQVAQLPLATEVALGGGEQVSIFGHQPSTGDWGVLSGVVSGRKGRAIFIQAPIQEQTSGGPVVIGGRVVGLVQSKDPTGAFGRAVTAQALQDFALGSQVALSSVQPVIRSRGSGCIYQTGTFDLDRGDSQPGADQADLFLNAQTTTERYLQPALSSGAQLAMISHQDFDRVTLEELERASYQRQGVDASRDARNRLPPGAVVAVRTSEGRLAKVRINSSQGDFVSFDWATYARPGEGPSPLQPNVEPCGVEGNLLCGTGRLGGDEITSVRVLERRPEAVLVELRHSQNPAHGAVWIGSYLLDKDGSALNPGFFPTAASPSGTTIVQVPLGRGGSRYLFVWLYESNRAEAFVCRRFDLRGY